jgi:PadR family transcriptional regulator PadR
MRGKHRRGGPDFWNAWQEELRQHGVPGARPGDPGAWREFFHQYTGEWPEQHWAFGGRRFQPWHKGDVNFNPFVANLFSQGGGLLPLIVLHLLREKPRYGNELMSLISEKTSGQWAANPGAIYPLMGELEDRGLVEGQWEDPRKRTIRIYHLTEKGKREMERVKAIVRPKLDEAIDALQTIVNDLNENSQEGETHL